MIRKISEPLSGSVITAIVPEQLFSTLKIIFPDTVPCGKRLWTARTLLLLQEEAFEDEVFASCPPEKAARQAIDWIEEKLEYRDYLKGKFDQGTNRITAHLKLNILKALSQPYRTADEFLLGLDSLAQRLARPADQSPEAALTLSTIHSSKGLEFDTVVLLDMMDGILPSSQAVEEAEYEEVDEMESEARLFYVAVTRARKKLVIFTSAFCNDRDRKVPVCFPLSRRIGKTGWKQERRERKAQANAGRNDIE